jgi:hypothetical protein
MATQEAGNDSLKWLARAAEAQAMTGALLVIGLLAGFIGDMSIGLAFGLWVGWTCMLQAKLEARELAGKWPLMWMALVWMFLGAFLGGFYALLGIPMNLSMLGMCAVGCLLALLARIEVQHWTLHNELTSKDEDPS